MLRMRESVAGRHPARVYGSAESPPAKASRDGMRRAGRVRLRQHPCPPAYTAGTPPIHRSDPMQYRRLGASGLQLSALSFGAWMTFGRQVGRGQARELVAAAWDHGINFFDNAEVYANGEAERVMGDVIADLRLPRDGFCVSSKVFFGSAESPRPTQRGLSRKHGVDACHAALKRLRVDYLDLYYCHRPDPDTPVEETVAAMDMLVRQGKILYWGTSEWPEALIREAARIARSQHMAAPVVEQPQY